ncbi:MAG: type 1 glutamine amidotransferase [Thiobacillaceae bacterium]
MNPVLVFRHSATEGAGYFSEFLDRHAIPWQVIRIDAGDALPDTLNGVSGLCLMGGPMSVNDALPWISQELTLIRQAIEQDIPVIGHCLGGQLLAKASGGIVTQNPVKEIGWGEVQTTNADVAEDWVGKNTRPMNVFHWHGETFSLPPGAVRILESTHCSNQAFILNNRHLGMQCHVEMTPLMVKEWCENGADEIAASPSPAVQTAEVMQSGLDIRTHELHGIADKVYTRWIQGLRQ